MPNGVALTIISALSCAVLNLGSSNVKHSISLPKD